MINRFRKGLYQLRERLANSHWLAVVALVFLLASFFGLLFWRLNQFVDESLGRLKMADQRINLLLLGAGGGEGQVKDLTDTMIFASLDLQQQRVTLIPLPRDIWVASLRAKLNTAYHYGSQPDGEGGLALTKQTVSDLLGQPVDYAVLVDFNGLVQVIDLLGGLEVEVERAFDDYRFPIPGKEADECDGDPELACRYEPLHFDQGWQVMDGQRALKYVRSRFAEGEEGTDFARSRRQQRLLLALQKKLLSFEVLASWRQLRSLFELTNQSLIRDVQLADYPGFLLMAYRLRRSPIETVSLEELFTTPARSARYDYQWVLVPTESWEVVQKTVRDSLKKD